MSGSAPVFLQEVGLVCALGSGRRQVLERLLAGDTSGMVGASSPPPGRQVVVGRVAGDGLPVPARLAAHDSRNNRVLTQAVEQLRAPLERLLSRYGPARLAVVIGTSTSGIEEGLDSLRAHSATGALPPRYHYLQQSLGGPALYLAQHLGLEGPAWVVSTACTSSANAFASARGLLATGLADAVLVGGADTLAGLTLAGFGALESLSPRRCNPLSRNRDGLNLGEAACAFLLTRDEGPVALLGVGLSSDAHHMSAPHPEGRGAAAAMRQALDDAQLAPGAVDYVNLHGTATPLNDAMESKAMAQVFGERQPPCSSTKALTGHTLGTAGALEAAFCFLALCGEDPQGRLPPHVWDGEADPALPALRVVDPAAAVRPRVAMSNSFAFGGNNVSLVLGTP